MQTSARVALAVGGGYLLGRTKKLSLALTVGSLLAGRKLSSSGLLGEGLSAVRGVTEYERLREQVMGVGRTAAISAASLSLGRLTDRIQDGRGAAIGGALGGSLGGKGSGDEAADSLRKTSTTWMSATSRTKRVPRTGPRTRSPTAPVRTPRTRRSSHVCPRRDNSKPAKKSSSGSGRRSRSGGRQSSATASSRGGRNG